MPRWAAAALLAGFIAQDVAAEGFWSQFKDPDDGRFDASSFLAENAFGFLPVPIIITDPAVDGGLGVVAREGVASDAVRESSRDPTSSREPFAEVDASLLDPATRLAATPSLARHRRLKRP